MKLTDRKWMPFKLGDICTVSKGVRLTKASMKPGTRPFVGATSLNNGITNWVSNTNDSLDRNVRLFGEMWHGLWRHEVGVASQGGMTCLLFRSAA